MSGMKVEPMGFQLKMPGGTLGRAVCGELRPVVLDHNHGVAPDYEQASALPIAEVERLGRAAARKEQV